MYSTVFSFPVDSKKQEEEPCVPWEDVVTSGELTFINCFAQYYPRLFTNFHPKPFPLIFISSFQPHSRIATRVVLTIWIFVSDAIFQNDFHNHNERNEIINKQKITILDY